MKKLLVLVFTLAVCATLETELVDDARTPSKLTEQVVLLQRITEIAKFDDLYSRMKFKILPKNVNRRVYCNKVKQQSETSAQTDVGCGSCVAFAVIAGAEMAYRVATGKNEVFSEMDIVDCMYHGGGCNGNIRDQAVMHVFNNGVALNSAYPYEPHDKKVCDPNPPRLHKHKFIPFVINRNNSQHWKTFIDKYGGFTMSIYVGALTMEPKDEKDFSKTVVTDCAGASTHPSSTNHAVFCVGYGVMDGKEYFLIRNSWGIEAGKHDKGYIRVEQGKCNTMIRDFHGFVYDQCDKYNKQKKKCNSQPECNYNGLTKKCVSAFSKIETALLDGAEAVAGFTDGITDGFEGVGIKDLDSNHVLRKNGTEFFAYLKVSKKNKNTKKVNEWFNKAVNAKAVNAENGEITDYTKLRKLLGLKKKDVTTYVACKAQDDAPSKANRENWYHLLAGKEKKKAGFKARKFKTFYDPRYNRIDYDELHNIIGKSANGKFNYESDTAGGFGSKALTVSEKKLYSTELVCYAHAGGYRVKNDAFKIIKKLPETTYNTEKKLILDYDDLKAKFHIKKEVVTYKCSANLWYSKEGARYWNCESNKFEDLPSNCNEFTPPTKPAEPAEKATAKNKASTKNTTVAKPRNNTSSAAAEKHKSETKKTKGGVKSNKK